MTVKVRPALPEDYPQVRELLLRLAEGFRVPAPEEGCAAVYTEMLLDPDAEVLVADGGGGQVRGLVAARYFVTLALGGEAAYISELVVAPAWRRRGVGTALLEASFARARRRGAKVAEVKTHPRRTAARGLYGAAGMEETCLVLERAFTDDARMVVADHRGKEER